MSSPIPVVGPPSIHTTDGSVPLRLEVRELQRSNPDQWNLYLLGLDALHNNANESEALSYFQIAGIHGRPYIDWNNVPGVPGNHWDGYCTHSSILFAPWHRPYLALYEQVLYSIIQGIASKYSGDAKTRYEGAASTFRLPYWDWAITPPDASFPSSISSSDTVDVLEPGPDGSPVQKPIPNPLYSYSFDLNYVNNGGWFQPPDSNWTTTLRYPTQDQSGDIVSNDSQVNSALTNQVTSLQENVYLIMSSYTDFAAFSNTQWDQSGNPGTYGSLEDIHNDIHSTVGGTTSVGPGHMSDPDYSAFDPVFWLHHCNIDRLLAMWQAINPGSYVVQFNSQEGTYTWAVNFPENKETPLTPFHRTAQGEFWKSVDVVRTETFQYAYPETQEWAFPDNPTYQASVRTAIKDLYGGNSPAALFESKAVLPPTRHLLAASKAKASNPTPSTVVAGQKEAAPAPKTNPALKEELKRDVPTSGDTNELSHLAPDGKYTEWITNIRAEKHAFRGTYSVHVFLGSFNEDERTWPFEPNLVGTYSIFCRGAGSDCGKCKDDREAGLIVTGIVPLTYALIEDVREGLLRSLNAEDVVPYLTRNLHWRVTLADGSHKPREEVPNLKVSVVSSQVTVPTARDEFPVHSDYTVHAAVTQGKPTGHNHGDPV